MKKFFLVLIVAVITSCKSEYTSPYPADQNLFLNEVRNYANQYIDNENGAFRTQLRMKRAAWINTQLQLKKGVSQWTGEVKEVSTSSVDNSIGLTLNFSGYPIEIKTWTNFFSDNLSGEKTMIELNSALGQKIVSLRIGQKVKFSGKFLADSGVNGIEEISITESGSMTEPEFTFVFTDIIPL
jgi:hypothetical protein